MPPACDQRDVHVHDRDWHHVHVHRVQQEDIRSWRIRVFAATWLSYFGFYFCRKPFFVAKAEFNEAFGWDTELLGTIGVAYLVMYWFAGKDES